MTTIYRPGQRVDAYEVVRLLGQGGSSRVYMAQDWRTQQSVVLKFPNDEEIGGAAIFARYQREAEIGRRLSHPSIQCHLNQREQRSREYLVLEYLQGHSLRAVMQKQAPDLLPVEHVIQIVLQVGDALVYVHKQGIIHQDIKPDNIFLLDTGHIKLLDFGIATFEETRQKRWRWWLGHSSLIGTPAYMSPERLRNRQGDLHADIYAVGIVLYELLCGRTPFIQDDGFALINQHLSHDPPDILQFQPSLSPALATVVMRAIRRDQHKRYAAMQAMLYDLRHLDEVLPQRYLPASPLLGGGYRQVIHLLCIVLLVCLGIIAFGMLAQFAHHAVR